VLLDLHWVSQGFIRVCDLGFVVLNQKVVICLVIYSIER
jgi:hypothetical protein